MDRQLSPEAEGPGDYLVLSDHSDSMRRSSSFLSAERRLLCAVLEDAIRTYLGNITRSSTTQRDTFHEVSEWFLPSADGSQSLFSFQTICDLLEINSEHLLVGLGSGRIQDLPRRRQHGVFSNRQARQPVARRHVDENRLRLTIRP